MMMAMVDAKLQIARPKHMVRRVRIQIGNEWVQHDWGREVPIETARDRAQLYLDALTTKSD